MSSSPSSGSPHGHPEWRPEQETAPRAPVAAPPRQRIGPWLTSGIAVVAMIALLVVIQPWDAQRRQAYADQLTVWANPPSSEIQDLAEATGMSETGRRVFFASLPSLEEAESFNAHCSIEGTAVLGCFDGERIYLFRITDERLAGTNEVTAAHEMLHAAYHRLGVGERAAVDELITAFVNGLELDDPVRQLVEGYPVARQTEEWNSRLGTEFAELSPELEAHYARYFDDDRRRVFALNDTATAELRDLQGRIDVLVAQIDALGPKIEARTARYEQELAAYDAHVTDFNARAAADDFPSQEAFDSERAALLDRQAAIEAERSSLNAEVDQYNELIGQLGDLDASYAELYSQLDSR